MTTTDNTAHAGTQTIDELVPSRYAVQVGDIEVLVISDGVLPITASTMATNADSDTYRTWLSDRFLPQDILDWPLNVVVVRSGDRTILVDAGLGVEFPDFPRAGRTVARLEAAGIDPSAVTDVVLTHLHMDHIGGLLSHGLKERLRPDLRIHVRPRRPTSGSRRISRTPRCPHRFRRHCVRSPVASSTNTAARSKHSTPSTTSRQESTSRAPAATHPATVSYDWHPVRIGSRSPETPCSRPGSTILSGTTGSNTTRRNPSGSASNCCASLRQPVSPSSPPICRSRRSAMWRPRATHSAAFPRSGTTDPINARAS